MARAAHPRLIAVTQSETLQEHQLGLRLFGAMGVEAIDY
jgi:hypothetical protein